MKYFHENIFDSVEENKFYRRVLYTVPGVFQVVVMSIPENTHIGMEMHEGVQSITIHEGIGSASLRSEGGKITDVLNLVEGDILVIPPMTHHDVWNRSSVNPLKLISYYTPPEHPPNRKQKNKPKHSD